MDLSDEDFQKEIISGLSLRWGFYWRFQGFLESVRDIRIRISLYDKCDNNFNCINYHIFKEIKIWNCVIFSFFNRTSNIVFFYHEDLFGRKIMIYIFEKDHHIDLLIIVAPINEVLFWDARQKNNISNKHDVCGESIGFLRIENDFEKGK